MMYTVVELAEKIRNEYGYNFTRLVRVCAKHITVRILISDDNRQYYCPCKSQTAKILTVLLLISENDLYSDSDDTVENELQNLFLPNKIGKKPSYYLVSKRLVKQYNNYGFPDIWTQKAALEAAEYLAKSKSE